MLYSLSQAHYKFSHDADDDDGEWIRL